MQNLAGFKNDLELDSMGANISIGVSASCGSVQKDLDARSCRGLLVELSRLSNGELPSQISDTPCQG